MCKRVWREAPKRPYQARQPAVTSEMMSKVRAKNTKPELLLRRALWARGRRYRLHVRGLVGKPDLVFTRQRVAVFVDGDFWHARSLIEYGEAELRYTVRGPKQEWWINKLKRNAIRDQQVTAALLQNGWRVLRLWESDVMRNVEAAADAVVALLKDAPEPR